MTNLFGYALTELNVCNNGNIDISIIKNKN